MNATLTTTRPTTRPATSRPRVTAPADRRANPPAELRLTRRGRLVLRVVAGLVLLVVTLVLFVAWGSSSVATRDQGTPVPTRTVVVGEGDTLWGIASDVAERGGTREMVTRIQELNALPGPQLSVGQEIEVPRGDG